MTRGMTPGNNLLSVQYIRLVLHIMRWTLLLAPGTDEIPSSAYREEQDGKYFLYRQT